MTYTEERDAACPRDLNFRKDCDDYKCGAVKSWKEGADWGSDWQRARAKKLVEALKTIGNCKYNDVGFWLVDIANEALKEYGDEA